MTRRCQRYPKRDAKNNHGVTLPRRQHIQKTKPRGTDSILDGSGRMATILKN